jgi:hypothetical protein
MKLRLEQDPPPARAAAPALKRPPISTDRLLVASARWGDGRGETTNSPSTISPMTFRPSVRRSS